MSNFYNARNRNYFKKTKVQELKYYYLIYKMQARKAGVPIKVKCVVAFYD